MGGQSSSSTMNNAVKVFILLTLSCLSLSKPWYQGDGLPDCAPGKCPKTAEVSPIVCSSNPTMFFNNGYPTLCAEGFTCNSAAADAGEGNPCRADEGGEEGYESIIRSCHQLGNKHLTSSKK